MKKVFLHKKTGFAWIETANIHARGYLFDRSDKLYTGEDLISYFEGVESWYDFEERVCYANGLFSVIVELNGEWYAATDPFRTFPLFYIRNKGEWIISDDPYYLAGYSEKGHIDNPSMTEFLATGYVTGNNTLVEGIRQIQAGEMIRFKEDSLDARFYYSYRCHAVREEPYRELRDEARMVFSKAFPRFIASLQGRPVVLPLSGGYDSRFIAAMLRQYEYDNVICFTYGRKGNPEVKISQSVAQKLGFPWIFIEYTKELIKDFPYDDNFSQYVKTGGRMCSMFYMQEFFAVNQLKMENRIPSNSIFVPGLYGDFLAGGMLNKHGNLSLEESMGQIAERIYNVKYTFKPPRRKDVPGIKNRIEKRLLEKFRKESDLAYSIHEDYDFKERYAKFINNSTATYLHFGYEFRLAFCDNEIVDFFRRLPLHAKVNKYLYDDILTNEIFQAWDVNFDHELQADEQVIRRAKLKNRIKAFMPEWFKRLFVNRYDDLYYNEITKYFKDDLARKGRKIKIYGNSYNSLIIQWYAESVRQYLNKLKST
ncbi:MAG TPA: asparagine synthase-related protein [Bacteroidales bacterium]|nr:asparagine synthase-related protein [Bacteroidales bacterium]